MPTLFTFTEFLLLTTTEPGFHGLSISVISVQKREG